jgi:peptidoglycan hydrolase-like protein with peptidoglycan-binding domain
LTVRAAQSVLLYLDYDPMGIDGVVGKNTLTALHMFQAAQGIPLTTGIDDGVMASLTAALPAAGYLSLV